jgi:hypothetical protein
MWRPLKELIAESPFRFIADNFPAFPAGNRLSTQKRQANFRYQLVGSPLSVICSGRPIELDKPHVVALATETVFLLFKEKVPLKFKK